MDTGSSAFILICSAMVCLMTPALAANGLAVHALVLLMCQLLQPCFHGWQLINMSQDIHPWLVVQPVW